MSLAGAFLILVTSVYSQQDFFGESFSYRLSYLGFPAASIRLTVPDTVMINGRKVFHVVAAAKSSSIFTPFYSVENTYHTYIDAASGLPVRLVKDIRQSTLIQQGKIEYDQSGRTATYEGGRFKSEVKKSIQENSHNLFSLIYFLRRNDLTQGWKREMNMDVESEPWKVIAEVVSKEKVSAAGRLFEAYKVSFRFLPVKEEIKRKHTDILTRRAVTTRTRGYFWIGCDPPYLFLKIDSEMSPFNTYTTMVEE